jgi:hypothetical protein
MIPSFSVAMDSSIGPWPHMTRGGSPGGFQAAALTGCCVGRLTRSILGQLMHLRISETTLDPRMRIAVLLLTPLLLTGCIKESASYFIDGGNQHTISVRAQQDYFWSKDVELRVVAARLPDCQRQLVIGKMPIADLQVELFASADNAYTLRAGEQLLQVETGGCTQLEAPAPGALGQPLGTFHLDERKKLVFDKAAQPAVAATGADA